MWNHPNNRLTISLSPWVKPNLRLLNGYRVDGDNHRHYCSLIHEGLSGEEFIPHTLLLYICVSNSWLYKWWGSCRRCAVVWYKLYRLHPRCQRRCDALIDISMPTSERDLKPFEAGLGKPCSLCLLLSGYKTCKPTCVCSMRKGSQHQEGWCWAFAWSRLSLQSRRANNRTSY